MSDYIYPTQADIQESLNFTNEDLAANQAGKMTERQFEYLVARRKSSANYTPLAMIIIYLLMFGCVVIGLGPAWVSILGIICMVVFIGVLVWGARYLIQRDTLDSPVQQIRGTVTKHISPSTRHFSTSYHLKLDQHRFNITEFQWHDFVQGGEYTLYYVFSYGLLSNIILSVEQHYPDYEPSPDDIAKAQRKHQQRLQYVFDFTEDDLKYNRHCDLSEEQFTKLKKPLRKIMRSNLAGIVLGIPVWIIFGLLVIFGMNFDYFSPDSDALNYFFAIVMGFVILAIFIFLVLPDRAISMRTWWRIQKDLNSKKVIQHQSRIRLKRSLSPDPRYQAGRRYKSNGFLDNYIYADDTQLIIPQDAERILQFGEEYTLYYLPNTKIIVAAERHYP